MIRRREPRAGRWLLAALLAGCSVEAAEPVAVAPISGPRPAPLEVANAAALDDPSWVGVIVAGRSVDVRSMFTAEITALPVALGGTVTRGDTLAELDPRSVDEAVEMRRAELLSARARVRETAIERRRAQGELQRVRRLRDDEHVSAAELERAELELERVDAALARTEADARQLGTALDRSIRERGERRIAAPFDGVVARRHVAIGDTVSAQSAVVRLLAASDPKVVFAIDAADARPAIGTRLRVIATAGGATWSARVVTVRPDADRRTGLVAVEAALDCADVRQCNHAQAVRVEPESATPLHVAGRD